MKLLLPTALLRVFKPAFISLVFMASVPTTALALNKTQAIKGCLDNTLSQIEKNELLSDMETWTTVFSPFVQENAGTCFTNLTGEPAEFVNNSGFITGEAQAAAEEARVAAEEARVAAEEAVRLRVCELRDLVRQKNVIINEAEAARQDRRTETLSATVQECSSWFNESPKEALTNDMCNSIFAAGGLPNSTISGPSQLELLRAELSKQNAETELEILVSSGMLIEDFMAQYGVDEEEPYEEYQCNE